jgi:hypothetical protein
MDLREVEDKRRRGTQGTQGTDQEVVLGSVRARGERGTGQGDGTRHHKQDGCVHRSKMHLGKTEWVELTNAIAFLSVADREEETLGRERHVQTIV